MPRRRISRSYVLTHYLVAFGSALVNNGGVTITGKPLDQPMLNLPVSDVELPATDGKIFWFSDAPKPLALYFYPRNSAPDCTTETQQFRDLYTQFSRLNSKIYDISRDSLRLHEGFKDKHGLPFNLLSNPEETADTLFDVIKMENVYGKRIRGTRRSTFAIGQAGTIYREWRKVKVARHAKGMLAFVDSL